MPGYRLIWLLHRWVGIAAGIVLLVTAVSGLMLLVKKDYAWIQPATVRGTAGPPEQLQPLAAVYAAVFALGLPQFRSEADIARIDFRPEHRVHKVISVHDHLEVQVDAISLATHGPNPRRSDLLETIHDGQILGGWVHGYVMPAVALSVAVLSLTGYVLWLWPKWRRSRRARSA